MADLLNRCIKCKCSLSAADKVSKLLPCLHTMCEDCISGRTDVAEKIKRLKEEKECQDVKVESEKQEREVKKESELKDEEKEDKKEGAKADKVQKEEPTEKDSENATEEESGKTNETEEMPEQKQNSEEREADEEGKDEKDSDNPPVENLTDKPHEEATCENSKADDSEHAKADDSEHSQADDTKEVKAGDEEKDDEGKEKDETGTEIPAEESKQKTEESRMDGVEETPPDPVPLTECPICREPFNPDTLIENVFIRKNAAASDNGEGKEQKCTGCETNPATSYCLQCDDWLCADCVNAHKRVRMTKDHQLTSLEEAVANKGGGVGPTEVSMLCRVHPKEKLTLFCEKCEVLTCRDCQLLQHQEHKYQFLQEAADSYKAKLTGSLSLMKDRRDVLKRYQTEIEERLSKVRREKGELQQDILRQADIIVKAVRAAVWSVLSSLHSFTDAAAKRLSREVGDVGDLVGKFDHCISFMDGILEDGFGLPLLFSKTIVETKCRKVYHTHMEPQSLKGQLNIQYRHDVQSVIRTLPNIGAIYVNGSKYPPEKSASQPPSGPTGAQNSSAYRTANVPGNTVVGGAPQSASIPHHLAPQERSIYMQMMMSRQSHPSSTGSQGPTLSLPGSRRIGSMGAGPSPRGWPGQQVGLPVSQAGMMAGMMGQGQSGQHQQMMAARAPSFQPMRLHHRPVDPNHMQSAPPMVLGAPHRPPHSHSMGPGSLLPAPPPLRSPLGQPQYRGAAEGVHINSGGQAAMSGIRRPSTLMDNSPDPARPASGGHNTPERPLSSEGAASSVRVKSEPVDSTDCVITSANFKGKKSTMPSTSLGELQKNLDEVIRGVPLDLGDNLEQINGAESPVSSPGIRTSTQAPIMSTSTMATVASCAGTSKAGELLSSSSTTITTTTTTPSTTTTTTAAVESKDGGEDRSFSNGTEQDSNTDADGHQVKGYATGNSMPGFTLSAVESVDPNDDYCAACHQGGDVLCCDQCPRVFHLQCHVPVLSVVPSGAFVCTLCEDGLVLEGSEDGASEVTGKRKAPLGLSDKDLKVCERILLELFCHPSSIPFHEPVNRAVPNYYKIINKPMDFSCIKCKMSRNHFNHYSSAEAFLDDCKLVFRNCAVYNSETSEVGKAGKIVLSFFERLVDKHMPEYSTYVRRHESPDTAESRMESERKRRKTTPPPHSGYFAHGEKSSDSAVHIH